MNLIDLTKLETETLDRLLYIETTYRIKNWTSTELITLHRIRHKLTEAEDLDSVLLTALEESLKLQNEYATKLNLLYGGGRLTFNTVQDWIKKLKQRGILKK